MLEHAVPRPGKGFIGDDENRARSDTVLGCKEENVKGVRMGASRFLATSRIVLPEISR